MLKMFTMISKEPKAIVAVILLVGLFLNLKNSGLGVSCDIQFRKSVVSRSVVDGDIQFWNSVANQVSVDCNIQF